MVLKKQFARKKRKEFSHYLLTVVQMENQVKFLTPQNISGASEQKKFDLKSQGTEKKNTNWLQTSRPGVL